MEKEYSEQMLKYMDDALDDIPDGWARTEGALTAPRGYFWAHKRSNPFVKGDSAIALIRERTQREATTT